MAVQLGSPFADFAVFTPYARKTTRAHRFTAYLPQPDGSWLAKEIPGPSNFQAWLCCWRVFRVACLMLKVAHVMPLDRYQRKIEKLAIQWPTAWYLVCLAEDKCMFEHFNRLKSRIVFDITLGRPAPPMVGCGVSLVSHFLEGSGGRRDLLGRQHSAPSDELAGTWKQGCPQGSRASGCGGHARL